MNLEAINKYIRMQKSYYEELVSNMSLDDIKRMVAWDAQDNWSEQALKNYENYFLESFDYSNLHGLDFGCGIGRMLRAFSYRFKQLDGIDLSSIFLAKAKELGIPDNCQLYQGNGWSLEGIPNDTYDFIYSGWVMEHICVHEIRYNYFKEFLRVLQRNGRICIQMCGGCYQPDSSARPWYDNFYDALATNSYCDTQIENLYYIANDLYSIGFKKVSFDLDQLGPECTSVLIPPQFAGHQYMVKIKAIK